MIHNTHLTPVIMLRSALHLQLGRLFLSPAPPRLHLRLRLSPYHTNGALVSSADPFKALDLEWGATQTQIKTAYRSLAMRYHPDVGSEKDAQKFHDVQKAYDVLTSKDFDALGHDDSGFTFKSWRIGDTIAQNRKDVAGSARRRPAQPAGVDTAKVRERRPMPYRHASHRHCLTRRQRSPESYWILRTDPSRSVGPGGI